MKRSGVTTSSSGGTDEPPLVPPAKVARQSKSSTSYWKINRWSKRGAFEIDKIHKDLQFSSDESSSKGDSDADNYCTNDLVEDEDSDSTSVDSTQDSSKSSDSESDYSDNSTSGSDSGCDPDNSNVGSDLFNVHSVPVESNDDDDHTEMLSGPVNCYQRQPQLLHNFSDTTVDQAVLAFMDSFFEHNKTKYCLKTDLEVMHKVLPKPNRMPKSLYLLFKYVENFAPQTSVTAYYCCQSCQLYYGTEKETVCPDCENKKSIKFHILDIVDQIKFLFEHRGLGGVLKKTGNNSNIITDITDGSEYKRVNINRGDFDVTVILSADGAAIKRSSKADFWPITFTIAEIPASLRPLFITCVGVWYSKRKPEMNTYFRPLCVRLQMLEREGELEWTDPRTGEQCASKISAPLIIADAPARADLLNTQHHNGKYGCNTCEIKTSRVKKVEGERRRRVYKSREEYQLRTKERMLVFGREAEKSNTVIKGVKGRTVLSLLPGVDESTVVFGEFMHAGCLGVIKQVLECWTTKSGAWSVKHLIPDLDKCMESIRVPSFFSRPPRKISESPLWKAYEYLYWALFYSVLVFASVLAEYEWFEPFWQHWMLFVIAIHILMQEEITTDDLKKAETLLKIFVREFEALYGEKELTYNLHQMSHICLNIRRWGLMWLTSAFPFENFIGVLGKTIHGNNNIGKEITQKIKLSQGVEVLRATVQIQNKHSNQNKCLGDAVKVTLAPDLVNLFDSVGLSKEKLQIFARVRINRHVFTSLIYKEVGTIDYCVRCRYNENSVVMGKIKLFCKCDENIFVVIDPLSIVQEKLLYHTETRTRLENILPSVESGGQPIIINVQDVKSMTHLLLHDNFVCAIPKPLRNKKFVM